MSTEVLFQNKKPNIPKLLAYGFAEADGYYLYSSALVDRQFQITVRVFPSGGVDTALVDTASAEEYVLHRIPGAAGAFVGRVREEYAALLQDIADACFERDVFKSSCARQIIDYVRNTYQNELEYLWEKFPSNAVWRRSDNNKWYGALLTVSKKKLGFSTDESVEIIDLRIDPAETESVIDGKYFLPGYHMNKKHWFTIVLDGSVPLDEICRRIDASYILAAKK